jgi:hypothetical protein
LQDARDALRYLLGESDLKPNDRVKHLYALVEADRLKPEFHVNFYIIVFGRLNPRAADAVEELRTEYASRQVAIHLVEMEGLIEEFVIGTARSNEPIRFDLRIRKGEVLRAPRYCYFLANGADLYTAFMKYGWRLFDLNLRYEVRNSSINGEIVESLAHSKSRKRFHHYNNGLIAI